MVINENLNLKGTIVMWAIILLELPVLIFLTSLYFMGKLGEDGWKVILIILGIMLSAFVVLMSIRLNIRLDQYGLAYQNPPFFNRWKKISITEISDIQVMESDGLIEYGGIGVRFSKKINAYLFYSDHILIVQSKKKKYVFSVRKPGEIQILIDSWKN